jgi:hypothetical protein
MKSSPARHVQRNIRAARCRYGYRAKGKSEGEDRVAMTVILHQVRDYDAWRRVYKEVAPMQKAGGVIAESVYRAKGDPRTVLVLHSFGTMAEAEKFVGSPELRAAMDRAGVEGTPRIEFFEEATG